MEIMARRRNPESDITNKELEEIENAAEDGKKAVRNREKEEQIRQTVSNTKVPVHGNLSVEKKDDEALRFLGVNINSMSFWQRDNYKADRLKFILEKYGVDAVGLQEVCINWSEFKASQTVATILRVKAEKIRSVASHNERETKNIGRYQRGGTATILRDQLAAFVVDQGNDHTGLGRWSWYKVEGEPGHKTYIITAYAPCGNTKVGDHTVYKQQERFIQEKGLKTNPKALFREDLLQVLRRWRGQGDRVILIMDANENVIHGPMCKQLAKEDINMNEVVHSETPGAGPKTWFRGSEAIDGIWVSSDIEVIRASYLPFDGSLGDHRPVVTDLTMGSVLGKHMKNIVPVQARRLDTKNQRAREAYIEKLQLLYQEHGVWDKLVQAEKSSNYPVSKEAAIALENMDRLMEGLMLAAEKKCRKLNAGHYEFSPEVKEWLDRCHAFRALLRLKSGKKVRNKGNVKRFALRCGIPNPMQHSEKETATMYRHCRASTKKLMAESPWMRREFLSRLLQEALGDDKVEEATRIKGILRNEAQKKIWATIHRELEQTRAPSPTRIEVPMEDGTVRECNTKEEVEQGIGDEVSERFSRASSAPVCQGALFDLLGYSADTEAALEILAGTFTPPPGTSPTTMIILEEIARIWAQMEGGEVDIVVSVEDFQHYWRRAKEKTASSFSGLHFGHYKAIAASDFLSKVHALKLTIISRTGSAPERWARGLSVMLEKIAGVALVTKLRAILLMEADFNYHNRLIFGSRMMELARKHDMIPEEIFSEKGKTAEDAILQQVLVYDIARQLKRPLVVASVDAAQCYDRVAHAMTALTLRAYKVRQSSVMGMLQPIQNMEYYLRTGYGESTTFSGGKDDKKQGLCQGNAAAPSAWQMLTSVLVRVQRRLGHGIRITSPISQKSIKQAGIVFVDDTNLWSGMEDEDDLLSAAYKGQEDVNLWARSLEEVGGLLQPPKCGWTIHDMKCSDKGVWEYRDAEKKAIKKRGAQAEEEHEELDNIDEDANEELDNLEMTVPQLTGDAKAIKRLKSSEAVKNLGLFARPDGRSDKHMSQMKERMEDWTVRVKNGALPTRSVWTSYNHQLWAGLKYGLGASSAPMSELREGLGSSDYYLISSLGVVRSIKKEWRYLPAAFCGMGLNNLVIETTSATLNSFLQHYNTDSALGITLSATLENLQLELGVQGCPLHYDYDIWSNLATESWIKSLWEKVDTLGLNLNVVYKSIPLPRQKDVCIMEAFVEAGIRDNQLIALNKCRKHQESLFMSDIATANGRRMESTSATDWKNSHEADLGKHRSRYHYGKERPTKEDWKQWGKELSRFTLPNKFLLQPLGPWTAPSARIWRHHLNTETGELEVLRGPENNVDIYSQQETNGRKSKKFRRRGTGPARPPTGVPVSVTAEAGESLRIINHGTPLHQTPAPEEISFMEFLKAWGGAWMWEGLTMPTDPTWLKDAVTNNTLVCVTDGSYSMEKAPDICGAGWIIYCTAAKRHISARLVERSDSASAYRGELLGMLAIHVILYAIEEYYGVTGDSKVLCDNKGAIYTFQKKSKRIPAGAKNNDIQRVLRQVKARTKSIHLLHHVKAHQDDYKKRRDLPLDAQLNCFCDDLAKEAVTEGIMNGIKKGATLPLESASVFIGRNKQTTDLAKGLRYFIGKATAREFYAKPNSKGHNIMDTEVFDTVAWEDLRDTLALKPKMYQLWFGKQGSDHCGTGAMLKRWDKSADSRCPNCRKVNEDANHLNRCRDTGRQQMLLKCIKELKEWMIDNNSYPELTEWIPQYLLKQGTQTFSDLGTMSPNMRKVGAAQDHIGWRHFTEGKIATPLKTLQALWLQTEPTRMTIDAWMRGLIEKLLALTHSQWIYRNITKHHHTNGTIKLEAKQDIMKEIERQLDLGLNNLPPESKFLLEIDTTDLMSSEIESQQYWLFSIEAARAAGERAMKLSKGKTTSWNDIMANGRFDLPTSSPPPETEPNPQAPTPPEPKPKPKAKEKSAYTVLKDNIKRAKGKASQTARRKRQKAKQGDSDFLQQTISTAAATHDRLGVLSTVPVPANHRTTITALLSPPPAVNGTEPPPTTIAARTGASVSRQSILTLNPGQWLNDEIITYVSRVIINQGLQRMHSYSSHFFDRLIGPDEDHPQYDFAAVANWSNNIDGIESALSLRELYIPINKNSVHWLFLRVRPEEKLIELWDSCGRDETNEGYLQYTCRYLYDVHRRGHPQTADTLDDWMQSWTCTDQSSNSPRQGNSDDCGIFTLVSMALISNGTRLQQNSYSQSIIHGRQTRRRIAYLIWSSGVDHPTTPWNENLTAPHAPGGQNMTKTRRAAIRNQRRPGKKRKREEHRVVLGGVKVRRKLTSNTYTDRAQPRLLLNRKRTTSSIANETAKPQPTTQRQIPARKRARQNETKGPHRTPSSEGR